MKQTSIQRIYFKFKILINEIQNRELSEILNFEMYKAHSSHLQYFLTTRFCFLRIETIILNIFDSSKQIKNGYKYSENSEEYSKISSKWEDYDTRFEIFL
ncbi:hypothetical protein RF11_03986 [Thelohanellus kitauei]|uniref:Uncharacterized protein n=1 Tax=Thelohanellus kitauei TaxID=669202 RepID=A0A0C2M147_THEKT|nr:hypothetical protein RF11_03986 [Thelohanellus kitauei]